MQTEIKRFTVDGVDTIVIGNWIMTCGNIIFHKNDLYNIQKRYPQISDENIEKIKNVLLTTSDSVVNINELKEIAKTDKDINMMVWYMTIGYKAMDNSYKKLKKLVRISKISNAELL